MRVRISRGGFVGTSDNDDGSLADTVAAERLYRWRNGVSEACHLTLGTSCGPDPGLRPRFLGADRFPAVQSRAIRDIEVPVVTRVAV